MLRTGRNTAPARRALFTAKHQFFFVELTLRVVTPETAQWTALEKNGCPYAVAVSHGEFLNVKDDWFGQVLTPPSLTAFPPFLATADLRSYSKEQGAPLAR